MNFPEFGRNGEVIGYRQGDPPQRPYVSSLKRRDHFAKRLILVFLLSGPLNPVGLLVALFFLRDGFGSAFGVALAINSYCSVGALIGLFLIVISKRTWTDARLTRLSLLITLTLYALSALFGILNGLGVMLLYFLFGFFLALFMGFPAALIGASYARILLFKESGS